MKVVDLNLILYAVNSDAPNHDRARDWWEGVLSGDEPVGLAWTVLLGFLRLSTRAGVLPHPLACEEALALVEDWLGLPDVVPIHPGEAHWPLLRGLLEDTGSAGNLTTDAHLAALAIEYDATLYSTDNDFVRFEPALRLVNPLRRDAEAEG